MSPDTKTVFVDGNPDPFTIRPSAVEAYDLITQLRKGSKDTFQHILRVFESLSGKPSDIYVRHKPGELGIAVISEFGGMALKISGGNYEDFVNKSIKTLVSEKGDFSVKEIQALVYELDFERILPEDKRNQAKQRKYFGFVNFEKPTAASNAGELARQYLGWEGEK